MPDILIRNVPEDTLDALKQRAARHRRSLQQELLVVLEAGAEETVGSSPAQIAAAVRSKLARSGRIFGDSAPLIREDRER